MIGQLSFCWRCAESQRWQMSAQRRVTTCDICGKRDDCSTTLAPNAWNIVAPGVEALLPTPLLRRAPELDPAPPDGPLAELLGALLVLVLLSIMLAVVAVMAAS